jgi:hypothetical protein
VVEARPKWKRRLLRVLVVLLALYVLGRAADYVWYRVQRPADFRDANWSGEWRTAKYFGVSGRLLVRLPDPLPENQDFQAEALVYYPVYSPWKTGKFVRMEFIGHFSPDARASAGKSTNDIPGAGKLKFKAVIGSQVVDYAAVTRPAQGAGVRVADHQQL